MALSPPLLRFLFLGDREHEFLEFEFLTEVLDHHERAVEGIAVGFDQQLLGLERSCPSQAFSQIGFGGEFDILDEDAILVVDANGDAFRVLIEIGGRASRCRGRAVLLGREMV